MNEKIFQIILTLIPVLGSILTLYVIPFIKEKIGNEKLAKYEEWTKLAVQSAEMMFKAQGMGADKKAYVVKFLNEKFNKKKVVITKEQIEILIEACVKQMKLEESK